MTTRPYSNRPSRWPPFKREIWRTSRMPRTGSGFNDAWIPKLMYSTWATTNQTQGIQQGFFFEEEISEPSTRNGFKRAINVWKELCPNSV